MSESNPHEFTPYRKTEPTWAVKLPTAVTIPTREGTVEGKAGDYLCIDPDGGLYPCNGDTFEGMYVAESERGDEPIGSLYPEETAEEPEPETDGGTATRKTWNAPDWQIHRNMDTDGVRTPKHLPHPKSRSFGALWLICKRYRSGITSKQLENETGLSHGTASGLLARAVHDWEWLERQETGEHRACKYRYVPTSELLERMAGEPNREWFTDV